MFEEQTDGQDMTLIVDHRPTIVPKVNLCSAG